MTNDSNSDYTGNTAGPAEPSSKMDPLARCLLQAEDQLIESPIGRELERVYDRLQASPDAQEIAENLFENCETVGNMTMAISVGVLAGEKFNSLQVGRLRSLCLLCCTVAAIAFVAIVATARDVAHGWRAWAIALSVVIFSAGAWRTVRWFASRPAADTRPGPKEG